MIILSEKILFFYYIVSNINFISFDFQLEDRGIDIGAFMLSAITHHVDGCTQQPLLGEYKGGHIDIFYT